MKHSSPAVHTHSNHRSILHQSFLLICISTFLLVVLPNSTRADTAAQIDRDVNLALQKLYDVNPSARKLARGAKGIMVFPNIIKGGFIFGGQYGIGSLKISGKTFGYFQTVAASYGLQIGAQSFGYAMFIMTNNGLNHLKSTKGWEVGVGPSVVVVDEGMAKTLTTSTAQEDIYVFFFDQKGLMAGLGIQGSKISRYTPDP